MHIKLDKRTIFVIGAGASEEANLPAGEELKGQITKLLDIQFGLAKQTSGDLLIVSALQTLVKDGRNHDISPYVNAAWHIRDALPQARSIDNFIDSQRGNAMISICGKLAIVRSILDAERNSVLYVDRFSGHSGINYNLLEKTWYLPFFQLLTEYCDKNDLEERFKSVALIIFNYDRCLEHFLYHVLQNHYRITSDEASKLLKHISIYHPYGNVGSLPWSGDIGAMEFGASPNGNQLLELTKKIKTFTEGTDPDSSDIVAIKEHMRNATKLIFIGFAFHKLNMKLISPDLSQSPIIKNPKCYATTYGISESDKAVVSDQICKLYKSTIDVRMASVACRDFFSEFWRSLAF
jgi:hypothetical protein